MPWRPNVPSIDVIELDYDNTYETLNADKGDGLVITNEAVISISQRVVFPDSPPIEVDTIEELERMPTPPLFLGDVPNAILVFRNWFKPVEHPIVSEDTTTEERTRSEAMAHAIIGRQNAMQETTQAQTRFDASMSRTFQMGMIGAMALGAIMLLTFGAVKYL